MTAVHADIEALKELHDALVRFRYAQRDAADRGDDGIEMTRASLESRASRWRSRLERARAELDACRRGAAQAAGEDHAADCAGYARAVSEAEERLERIRLWQYRVDQQASEFRGIAGRFRTMLDSGLPETENHLLAIIASLEAARGVPAPRS